MNWKNIKYFKPEPFTEVLVLISGHRTSNWSNTYTLVAFLNDLGNWQQWQQGGQPIEGVIAWTEINIPENAAMEFENDLLMALSADSMVILPRHEYDELVTRTYAENKPERPYLYPSAE